jgi:DMSO/TMAO reductase YedYZ molybdopterin-dependent catalytic subunit
VGVLECAGNGRGLYEPSVIGLQWEYGAVGNGRWAGVRLADVLKRAGLKASGREVLFDGADVPVGTMPEFQRTIPVPKALDPDTLLAYEMNGAALPASHGYPLRLVAPGWAGDCWVKWLTKIRVLDKEFDGFFMKTAYRYPKKPVAAGTAVDPADMDPVTSLRVKSIIATPLDGARVASGPMKIAGAAWSGTSPIASVEVSTDGGRNWQRASLEGGRSRYGWRLWRHQWTPPRDGYYTLMARARDASGDSQPFAAEWNPSGYLHNVVHQIGVAVGQPGNAAATPKPAAAPLPAKFKGSCIGCHELDVIEQQRLTRGQWEREVDKMAKWGATVKPEDRSEIVEFLVNRFGPRPRR